MLVERECREVMFRFKCLHDDGYPVEEAKALLEAEFSIDLTNGDPLRWLKHKTLQKTWVYWLHNKDEVLLYVGVTQQPHNRFMAHSRTKSWWETVAFIRLRRLPTLHEAWALEREVICNNTPLYNVAGKPGWSGWGQFKGTC